MFAKPFAVMALVTIFSATTSANANRLIQNGFVRIIILN